MECPHCGANVDPGAAKAITHPVFDDGWRCITVDGLRRRVTPLQWRMLVVLRERFRRFVPKDFLARAAARDALDGGSLASVQVNMMFLRRLLDGTPFAIAGRYGEGYGLFPADEVAVFARGRADTKRRLWYVGSE